MIQGCKICLNKSSKYKCPKCFVPFCSVPCGQTHRGSAACNDAEKKEGKNPLPLLESEWNTEHTVSAEKLSMLSKNRKLLDILQNPDLRTLLRYLDNSKTPDSALQEAMKDDTFRDFVDICLSIVDPEVQSVSS